MDEQLLTLLRGQDIVSFAQQDGDSPDYLTVARQCHEIGKHYYWKQKNLERCIVFLQAGTQFAIKVAEQDTLRRSDILSVAKAMSYDLASFTWRGWEEPGIEIAATDEAMGLEAARRNLRLGEELNKGDLPLSRAHWMLGAQLLSAQNHGAAVQHFENAGEYARKACSEANALLATGFVALTSLLIRSDNQESAARLESAKKDLVPLEHGPSFVSQIETAAKVFRRIS